MNLIDLPKIEDKRGNLSFIESLRHVPFSIQRTFWIYDVAGGEDRDGHAFHTGEEFIVALSGSFDVVLNDGMQETSIHLNRSYKGLHVPPMTWRKMENFATNSVVLVLASNSYDPNDYIEDFNLFLQLKQQWCLKPIQIPSNTPPVQPTECPPSASVFSRSDIDDCLKIDLQKAHIERGCITVVEATKQVPFELNRTYYLYDVPGGAERGGHAHFNLYQLIVAAAGSFEVILNDGDAEKRVMLNRPNEGLLLVPGIWRTLENFSSGSVCLVLASQYYDPLDYIYRFDDFERIKKGLKL